MSETGDEAYDPDRHESQVVAVFEDRRIAEAARHELLNAGVPAASIHIVDREVRTGAVGHRSHGEGGFWAAIADLFAPDQDVDEYGQALGHGHAMVLVTPGGTAEREIVIEVLEGRGPIDVDGRKHGWSARSTADAAAPVDHRQLNHASVSRADMAGHVVPGHEQTVRDMTGREMTVQVMSAADLGRVVDATQLPLADVPSPAEPALAAEVLADMPGESRVTYTYGIPEAVARSMSVDERIEAQASAATVNAEPAARAQARTVEERLRVGWRERHARAVRVRSYVAEKRPAAQLVEMSGAAIEHGPERPAS